mgnify:FL=1|jgi:hypothetical protein
MKIRQWQRKDFPQMIELGDKMHQEGGYKNLSYSKEKLKKFADVLIDKPEKAMGFVAVEDDVVIGMMIVHLSRYFFGDDLFCFDLLLYVAPEKRKSVRVPIRLINASTDWAREKGCKEFRPGSSVGIKSAKVEKLYNFMKFETIGNVFTKRL